MYTVTLIFMENQKEVYRKHLDREPLPRIGERVFIPNPHHYGKTDQLPYLLAKVHNVDHIYKRYHPVEIQVYINIIAQVDSI